MNWDVVLENKAAINGLSRKLIRNTNLDVEDFIQQVYINIASNYHNFDPMRGSFYNFLYWRIMATRKACLYQMKNQNNLVHLNPSYDLPSNSFEKMEIQVEYNNIYNKISDLEREAFDSVVQGTSRKDLKMNYYTRNQRIYRLRDKLCQTARK